MIFRQCYRIIFFLGLLVFLLCLSNSCLICLSRLLGCLLGRCLSVCCRLGLCFCYLLLKTGYLVLFLCDLCLQLRDPGLSLFLFCRSVCRLLLGICKLQLTGSDI